MTLFRAPIVILDTETTGIPARHPFAEAVEWAAVLLDVNGREVSHFATMIRPNYDGPEIDGALAINRISRADLTSAPSPIEAHAMIWDWMVRSGLPFVTAFNVAFDREICRKLRLSDLRWASCIMERAMAVMGPEGVLRAADRSHPRYESGRPWLWPSLAAAGDFFGVPPQEPAHRALADARRAAGIACAIRTREVTAAALGVPS